jgi:hypothetical protein
MKTLEHKEVTVDTNLIAYCGLYCAACRSHISGKCPGCRENVKASWCQIRKCCKESNLQSCAGCNLANVNDCNKFNNFISRIFAFIFKSDRAACIQNIREKGYNAFAVDMARNKMQSIKRK